MATRAPLLGEKTLGLLEVQLPMCWATSTNIGVGILNNKWYPSYTVLAVMYSPCKHRTPLDTKVPI